MKIQYFDDTDTLYIEFSADNIDHTNDLDENTQIDLSADGKILALTLEHAKQRTNLDDFVFQKLPQHA